MQRFFVEPYQIEEEMHRIHINGTDVNHIKNVLRMKCGEDVWISDGGNKEYHCQKAVELGAFSVIPVETKRCVVKLDAKKAAKKVARWQQIAESAAKQSKRMLIPEIHEVMTYKEALAFAGHLGVKLIPYELAKGMKETREILNELRPGQSIGIFIGPEGGFEEEEVTKALEAGAHAITLGRRILRTETAGLAILSVLMFQLENE